VAVRHPGDDDRPTVDLGPRPELREGDDADPGDLGPDQLDDDPALGEPTRTLTPGVHAQPTQKLPPRGTDSQSKYSTATSHTEAMRLEEIARTQVFLRVALITCFAGFFVALLTKGDPVAFRVISVGCVVTAIGCAWMLTVIREPARYSARRIFAPALVVAFGAFGGVYYWGVASPVAAMITYGIYFFSLGSNGSVITAMYALVALLHGALGFAIVTGVIDDRANVNGAAHSIAGIVNAGGNVLGMMPHPENHVEDIMGCTDGRGLFAGLVAHLERAA